MDNGVVLKLENINKVFTVGKNGVAALKNVSCSFNKGEFVAIMGSSGSGKTTLLNIIGGLESPTSGDVYVNGNKMIDYHKEPQATVYRRENIGFVFQFFQLIKDLTVEENITLPLLLAGKSVEVMQEETHKILNDVGLFNWRKHRPMELSGGQQQRVAIARALINSPALLLADEPTGNLDSKTSTEILNLILETKEKRNQTIILVTHDPKVASFSDRILFFHDGIIVDEHIVDRTKAQDDRIDDIFNKFKKCII